MSEDPEADDTVETLPEPWFGNCDEFVREFLLPCWRHPTAGSKWCAYWWEHAEAVSRLDALWRSFEALRVGDPTGMAVWWRDYAGPIMAAPTDPTGTFAGCNANRGEHLQIDPWPVRPAPERLFRYENTDRSF
jgi:hypothetical protein